MICKLGVYLSGFMAIQFSIVDALEAKTCLIYCHIRYTIKHISLICISIFKTWCASLQHIYHDPIVLNGMAKLPEVAKISL